MIIIYMMTKKHPTDHHVKEMVDSMSQKKRRGVYQKPLGDNEVKQHNK